MFPSPRPSLECFNSRPDGLAFVESSEVFRPAEQAAAELFRGPLPDDVKGCKNYAADCFRYLREHTEIAACPRFAPHLERRIRELEKRIQAAPTQADAQDIAAESRSMVASLVLRLGPPNDIGIKPFGTPPGNIPEALDWLEGLPGGRKLMQQAQKVDRMHAGARAQITALYEQGLKGVSPFERDMCYGPSPDALILAAQAGRPFDEVRQRMLP